MRVIRECLSETSIMMSNAASIEVEAYHGEYDPMMEFMTLGVMDFEVLPAKRSDRPKRAKPYEQNESKKFDTPKIPMGNAPKPVPTPNQAYVELPTLTILWCTIPVQPMKPTIEDDMMEEEELSELSTSKRMPEKSYLLQRE